MTEKMNELIFLSQPKTKQRFTLTRTFTSALVLILLLFVLLSSVAYYRILGFESVMSNVADVDLPRVVLSGRLFGHANKLAASAEMLSKASSKASRRIAKQDIAKQIATIRALSLKHQGDKYLGIQLDIISTELADFSRLIDNEILVGTRLDKLRQTLYQLHSDALTLSPLKNETDADDLDIRAWQLNFTRLVTHIDKALSQDRLQNVRQMFNTVERKLMPMQEPPFRGIGENIPKTSYFNQQLLSLLESEDGLLSLKVQQLRLAGRVIGRANFLHILINDYARLLEFSANEIDQAVMIQNQQTALSVKSLTRWLGVIFLFAIIVVAIIVILIQKKVVQRLVTLNLLVQDKLKGVQENPEIKGNDEISDMARTFIALARTIEKQRKKLEHLSLSDSLTGVANRRAFDEKLLYESQLSLRHQWPISLLLIDVDLFRLYNDHYGHSSGDKCLQGVAKTLSQVVKRNNDYVARFGGEEFVCILPDTPNEGARSIAQNIMDALADLNLPHAHNQASTRVTVSIGIATSITDKLRSPDELINNAGSALSQAKANGRNTYQSYSENPA
ncbi:MAG: diguanylate cyclase (GGDEF)-like protein [Paraglaciecola sp.]|jgi:diguanylate cyclase (GGDEF)-like protein